MEEIDLTDSQERILTVLVDRYQRTESPVTGETIADDIDRSLGNLWSKMQSLKALDLVEAIPGPKGGYKPTTRASEVLDLQDLEEPETLVLARDYDRVDTTVDEIDFTDVNHPEECRATIHFRESVSQFEEGDPIVIGPTPISKLIVAGEVVAVDPPRNEVTISIVELEAPSPEA